MVREEKRKERPRETDVSRSGGNVSPLPLVVPVPVRIHKGDQEKKGDEGVSYQREEEI
jgi:hypothetical protein